MKVTITTEGLTKEPVTTTTNVNGLGDFDSLTVTVVMDELVAEHIHELQAKGWAKT